MRDRRVLFFGDSHVVGVGDPTGQGWVGRVIAASFAAGIPATAYNLGVRGEASVEIGARWLSEARPRLLAQADTRVVLAFGINDTTVEGGQRRVREEHSRQALARVLDETASNGLPTLVVGPAPVSDRAQNSSIEVLSAAFAELCRARGTPFIPVFEQLAASEVWMAEVGADDGAHPSSEGYGALAQIVLAGGFQDWLLPVNANANPRTSRA